MIKHIQLVTSVHHAKISSDFCWIFLFECKEPLSFGPFVWGPLTVAQMSDDFESFFLHCRICYVFTSPSLFLLAVWGAGAPPDRPPPLCCILLWRDKGCAKPGGSWWTPANTDMCVRHGVPPAGHGNTFPPSPVREEKKKRYSLRKGRPSTPAAALTESIRVSLCTASNVHECASLCVFRKKKKYKMTSATCFQLLF